MNCCDPDLADAKKASPAKACPYCKARGSPVSSRTLFHHIVPAELNRIAEEQYFFCKSSQCQIVYFAESGSPFETKHVRKAVSVKASSLEDDPLCYCFGFSSSDVKKAALTKSTSVSQIVRNLIARHICDCEIRNPSGKCCLSEIMRVETASKSRQK